MKTDRLDYQLPSELIAQEPAKIRSASRLLVYDRGSGRLTDSRFESLGEFIRAGDCLVLNDTKVLAARFFGHRGSSGRLEGLFVGEREKGVWEILLKGVRKVKTGETIYFTDRHNVDFCTAEVIEKLGDGKCLLRLNTELDLEGVLDRIGYPPLPPYIKRDRDWEQAVRDRSRYQTVYARQNGAVAAPTAGLHFTEELIRRLKAMGVLFAVVTLHVGPGTFKPVTAAELEKHEMESEHFSIDAGNAELINSTKAKGGRVIAVGTTVVRTLESVADGPRVRPMKDSTRLFIVPGYAFKVVDAMVTNFHLPKSTLLALVAAFGGLEAILGAYHHAVEQRYRFYSYGDAMLIL